MRRAKLISGCLQLVTLTVAKPYASISILIVPFSVTIVVDKRLEFETTPDVWTQLGLGRVLHDESGVQYFNGSVVIQDCVHTSPSPKSYMVH